LKSIESKWKSIEIKLISIDRKLKSIEIKLISIGRKLKSIESKLISIESKLISIESKLTSLKIVEAGAPKTASYSVYCDGLALRIRKSLRQSLRIVS